MAILLKEGKYYAGIILSPFWQNNDSYCVAGPQTCMYNTEVDGEWMEWRWKWMEWRWKWMEWRCKNGWNGDENTE